MRIIKFRVWVFESDIKKGYMLDIYEKFEKDCNSDYYLVYEDFRDLEDGRCKNCIPLQFTGLHDKNGKELYEGDIIKGVGVTSYNKPVIRRVAFDDASARFGLSDVNGNITFEPLKWISFPLEIIGNIYENPELISKTPTHEH